MFFIYFQRTDFEEMGVYTYAFIVREYDNDTYSCVSHSSVNVIL